MYTELHCHSHFSFLDGTAAPEALAARAAALVMDALLFERFLAGGSSATPDIDVDFAADRSKHADLASGGCRFVLRRQCRRHAF